VGVLTGNAQWSPAQHGLVDETGEPVDVVGEVLVAKEDGLPAGEAG
jgi:hypothetical protein